MIVPIKLPLNAAALERIAERALSLAKALRAQEPSIELALAAGIHDQSYYTPRFGMIPAYSGRVELTLANGSRWLAEGYGPTGSAEYVSAPGGISFTKLEK